MRGGDGEGVGGKSATFEIDMMSYFSRRTKHRAVDNMVSKQEKGKKDIKSGDKSTDNSNREGEKVEDGRDISAEERRGGHVSFILKGLVSESRRHRAQAHRPSIPLHW